METEKIYKQPKIMDIEEAIKDFRKTVGFDKENIEDKK